MDLNKLRSDLRQHLQKRYVRTQRTDDLALRVADAVVAGDISWEQFFDDFIPYISSYAHPMLFDEERPFVTRVAKPNSSTDFMDSNIHRANFFRMCVDTINGGWRADSIDKLDKTSKRNIVAGAALAFMGAPISIDLSFNDVKDTHKAYLTTLSTCCNVELIIRANDHMPVVADMLADQLSKTGLRRLVVSFECQPSHLLDLSGLRNLTWLTIKPHSSAGDNLDLVELFHSGTIKLPPNAQFLSLQQGNYSNLQRSGLNYGSIPLPDPRVPGSSKAKWPISVLENRRLTNPDDAEIIAAPLKLTKANKEKLIEALQEMSIARHHGGLIGWWEKMTLEMYVDLIWPERLSMSSLVAYSGPAELLSPEGCPNLLFLEPTGGFPLCALHGTVFKAEVVVSWIKGYIASRFQNLEAIGTIWLNTKERQSINGKLSMVEQSFDEINAYRRYYMGER